jgi:CRISPR system Cascade subunit CasD
MSVLLLRLAGPMQSWGTRSRFSNRDTGLEPSRSGVIGLLCAAIGWPREKRLDDFRPLKMAVRVDREGRLMRDYHTAQNVRRADATKGPQETVLSERFYLADADFLVGLKSEGDRAFLDRLDRGLGRPVWTLCLGRKSFVPSFPLTEGISDGELIDVLKHHRWAPRDGDHRPPAELRFVSEVEFGKGEPRPDVPLSFVSRDRRFEVRHVETSFFPPPADLVRESLPESPDVPQQTGSQHP